MFVSVDAWFSEVKSDRVGLPMVGLGLAICGLTLQASPLHSRQLLNTSS